MEHPAPHSLMKSCRMFAVYISSDNKWYPARNYQDTALKDFLKVIDSYSTIYKKMLDENITIPKELTKKYELLPGLKFSISYDVNVSLQDESIININTYDIKRGVNVTHLAILYHSWDTIDSLKKRKPISKMGTLSEELCELIRPNNNYIY
jgi:hypothetical protein